jgi:hypothetical protein
MAVEFRRYEVEVFSQTMVLHGIAHSSLRLSDLVNERGPYLGLEHVKIVSYLPDAVEGLEQHQRGLVNKSSIVLVTEVDNRREAPEELGLRVEKLPNRILVYTDQFAINADLNLLEGIELVTFLTRVQERFLPVTNATATPTQPGSQVTSFRRDFMLINRDRINYIGGTNVTPTAYQRDQLPPAAETPPDDDLIG